MATKDDKERKELIFSLPPILCINIKTSDGKSIDVDLFLLQRSKLLREYVEQYYQDGNVDAILTIPRDLFAWIEYYWKTVRYETDTVALQNMDNDYPIMPKENVFLSLVFDKKENLPDGLVHFPFHDIIDRLINYLDLCAFTIRKEDGEFQDFGSGRLLNIASKYVKLNFQNDKFETTFENMSGSRNWNIHFTMDKTQSENDSDSDFFEQVREPPITRKKIVQTRKRKLVTDGKVKTPILSDKENAMNKMEVKVKSNRLNPDSKMSKKRKVTPKIRTPKKHPHSESDSDFEMNKERRTKTISESDTDSEINQTIKKKKIVSKVKTIKKPLQNVRLSESDSDSSV
jgi:hypothetical protein